jgi:hypothetical protein
MSAACPKGHLLRYWRSQSQPRGVSYVFVLALALAFPAVAQTGAAAKLLLGTSEPKPAASSPAPAAAAPATPASHDIPLPDVAARSEDLKRMLREVSDGLPSPDQLSATKATLDARSDELQSREKGTDALLKTSPSALEIREEENYWRALQKETAATRRELLEWANTAQAAVQQLQAQQPQWNATLEENKSTPDLGPTLDVIQQSVTDLHKLTAQVQDQLRVLVNLQVRAGSQDQLALDVLYRLNKAQQDQDSRLFERDSLPLWQVSQRREEGESKDIYLNASTRLLAIRAFAVQTRVALILLAMFLFLSWFGAYRLYTDELRPADGCSIRADTACRSSLVCARSAAADAVRLPAGADGSCAADWPCHPDLFHPYCCPLAAFHRTTVSHSPVLPCGGLRA